jgi:hypothetical protein
VARVVLPRPLAAELFGGRETLAVAGKTLIAVIRALEAEGPGFEARAGHTLAIAVDGVLADDWSTPVGPQAEILVVSRVAGGEARP